MTKPRQALQSPRRVCATLATLVILSAPISAYAQGQPEGFTAGLGLSSGNSIYIGEDNNTQVTPILRYDTDRFSIGIPDGLRVTVWDRQAVRFSAVLTPRFSEIDASDAPELAGLDRDITLDGGLLASVPIADTTRLAVRAVTEVTDEHSGSEVSVAVNHTAFMGRFPVILDGGVTWQSDDLAGYLYGVSATEATADRAAFDPGAVLIPHVSVGTAIPVSDRARLIGNIRADFLPDDVTDSPIVDEDVAVRGFLGISYGF